NLRDDDADDVGLAGGERSRDQIRRVAHLRGRLLHQLPRLPRDVRVIAQRLGYTHLRDVQALRNVDETYALTHYRTRSLHLTGKEGRGGARKLQESVTIAS